MTEEKKFHNPLVQLAHDAIRLYLTTHIRTAPPRQYYKILEGKSACFVTLKKKGELRGCRGTVEHKEVTLGQEIITNAIAAATEDSRFPSVKLEELDSLEISVDVLDRLRECSRESLDPQEFGIVLEQGEKRGVLLPRIEGVNTVEKQFEIAAKKGGIDLSQDYRILRFRTERFGADSVLT